MIVLIYCFTVYILLTFSLAFPVPWLRMTVLVLLLLAETISLHFLIMHFMTVTMNVTMTVRILAVGLILSLIVLIELCFDVWCLLFVLYVHVLVYYWHGIVPMIAIVYVQHFALYLFLLLFRRYWLINTVFVVLLSTVWVCYLFLMWSCIYLFNNWNRRLLYDNLFVLLLPFVVLLQNIHHLLT